MKVHRMGMAGAIEKIDADMVAFGGANGGAGYAGIISPGLDTNAGHQLNLFHSGNEVIFAKSLAVGQGTNPVDIIEIGEDGGRVKAVASEIDPPHDTWHIHAIMRFV